MTILHTKLALFVGKYLETIEIYFCVWALNRSIGLIIKRDMQRFLWNVGTGGVDYWSSWVCTYIGDTVQYHLHVDEGQQAGNSCPELHLSLGITWSNTFMCKEIPSSFFSIRLYIDHNLNWACHLKPTSARSPCHAVLFLSVMPTPCDAYVCVKCDSYSYNAELVA